MTRLFQTVYAAAVDTIFVCCFSDAHHYGGRYASESSARWSSPPVGSPKLKGGKHGRSSFGEDDDDDGPVTRMI